MSIKEKRYEQLQPFITEMGGWANFKHYVKYHDKIVNLIELAEEVMTHPAVFSEAELRNESLKIRRDKFMNALHKIIKKAKNG